MVRVQLGAAEPIQGGVEDVMELEERANHRAQVDLHNRINYSKDSLKRHDDQLEGADIGQRRWIWGACKTKPCQVDENASDDGGVKNSTIENAAWPGNWKRFLSALKADAR